MMPALNGDSKRLSTSQTIAAPYSLRPRPGATVSTPLEWREVKKGLRPRRFTIKTIFRRLKTKGDLLKPILQRTDLHRVVRSLETDSQKTRRSHDAIKPVSSANA
jgi:DNA primase